MKKFLLAFFLVASSVVAQEAELQKDAVRAFQENDLKTARSLFQSLLALNPKNTAAQNYLRTIALKERSGGGSIEIPLRQVILPKVEFTETSVREAVAYVAQRIKALTDGKQTLNVVWMVPADFDARITLSLQNLPATEALKYIASSANLELDYGAHALSIKPLKGSAPSPAVQHLKDQGVEIPPGGAKSVQPGAETKKGISAVEASLTRITIPNLEFNDATVREAVTFIGQQVKSLSGGQQSLNIVWALPADLDPRITLSLQSIPASAALEYVASSANLQLDYSAHALTIRPAQ